MREESIPNCGGGRNNAVYADLAHMNRFDTVIEAHSCWQVYCLSIIVSVYGGPIHSASLAMELYAYSPIVKVA